MTTKYTPMEREQAVENIAIGVHTGLRKGSEAPTSGPLWQAIAASEDSAWMDACTYCIVGLEHMGYKLCKVEEVEDPTDAMLAEMGIRTIPTNEDGSTNWPVLAQRIIDIAEGL